MKKKIFVILFTISLNNYALSQNYEIAPDSEIVISASKLINNKLTGGLTHILTRKDIQNYPSDSLPEIISSVPGVEFKSMYGVGFGVGESIDMRGFADSSKSNTLILLNGQKLSNIDNSFVDFTTIPINSIERIEIIKGNSAGVLYGAGATAGAINIITDKLPGTKDEYFASTSFGSYGKNEVFVSGSKTFNEYSVKANFNNLVADGFRRNSALRQKNGNIELNGIIDNNLSYHFNYAAHDQFNQLPGTVSKTLWDLGDYRSSANEADININNGHKFFFSTDYSNNRMEITFDGSYKFQRNQAYLQSAYSTKSLDTTMDVFSLTPKIKLSSKLINYDFRSIIGLDLRYTFYDSDRVYIDGMKPYHIYKGNDYNAGIYLNTEADISQNDKIAAGIRLQGNWLTLGDQVDVTAARSSAFRTSNSDLSSYEPLYSYHLGYERNLNDFGKIFTRIASSFRYPTVDDRIGTSAYNVSHNFQLKPQRSQDFEIGHTYSNKRVVLTNNFFYMRLRDEIYFDAKSYLNVNLDATERYGIESSIDINVNSNISLNNSFSAIKTNLRKASLHANHAKGSEIPGVPSMTNKTQLNLKYDKYLNFFTNIY